MTKILILGYGNPLRGDDGVGPAVALALQDELENHRRDAENTDKSKNQIKKTDAERRADEAGRPANTIEAKSLSVSASSSASSASLRCNPPQIHCKALHQLTPEIAADVAEANLVIFIDASCDNGPGEVASRRVVPESSPSNSFSHQLTPEVLLAFAGRLYGTCPEAILFSVGAASFEYGERLSAEVQAAVPVLLAQVHAACAASIHSSTSTSRNPE